VIEVALALGRPGSGIAHLAHLGGFLGGFVYMRQLVSSGGFSRRRGFFASIRQRWSGLQAARQRRGFQVVPDEPEPDDLAAEVDRILDKIGQSGLESLTPEERETLERRRKKLQRGR
ncbi:MAG: rhomboid family intramembrane serine protease, partial [Lentisphaerae bacterium]|nr:rhomboid family intramembrane serine protease [Lentisphaerota bacterium]